MLLYLLAGLLVVQARIARLAPVRGELTVTQYTQKAPYDGEVASDNSTLREAQTRGCGCAPVTLYPDRAEYKGRNGNGKYGCVGGCGGTDFVFHRWSEDPELRASEMETVRVLQMWPCSGADGGMQKICYTLTNEETHCYGVASGAVQEKCEFVFEPTDRLMDMYMHGNGHGTRFGRLQFNVNRAGRVVNYDCGCGGTAYKVDDTEGAQISGFFGKYGNDIDQLGITLVTPKCHVISTEIVKIECRDTNTEGNCIAAWEPSIEDEYFTMESTCDACEVFVGETDCSFTFGVQQLHQVTTTSTEIDSLGGGVTISSTASVDMKIFGFGVGGEITSTVEVNYSHSWEESKSQTAGEQTSISNTCGYKLPAGYAIKATGTTRMGNMKADMIMTVRTTTDCGDVEEQVMDSEVAITDVAIIAAISNCVYEGILCADDERCQTYMDCNECNRDYDCVWVNNQNCKSHKMQQDWDEATECPTGKWYGKSIRDDSGKSCVEAGYEFITNEAECKEAVEQLGLEFHAASKFYPAPQGCYGVPEEYGVTTGHFSYAPENANLGAVEYRYPICKDYTTPDGKLRHADHVRLLGDKAQSCISLNMAYHGAPSSSTKIEHLRDCWLSCKKAGYDLCAGITWLDSKSLCNHYKPKAVEINGLKDQEGRLSMPITCHIDEA